MLLSLHVMNVTVWIISHGTPFLHTQGVHAAARLERKLHYDFMRNSFVNLIARYYVVIKTASVCT